MPALVENAASTDEEVTIKPKLLKKMAYVAHLQSAFDEYDQAFLVNADNVGSKQMQEIRTSTREDSLLVFGKNTQMRKAILEKAEENPDLKQLVDHLKGNIGFVFTKGDLKEVRDRIVSNKVPAPARAGAVAQVGVTIPAGLTGMEPTQTTFFQALNIPTKISRGQIEIMSDVELFKEGEKVSSSEVALLTKMNIKPFSYGLQFKQVYDKGSLYSPDVLDITDDRLKESLLKGISNIAAVSLAIGYPTRASVPHSIMNGLKNLVAVSLATEYTIKAAEKIKAILDDPEALAAMAAAAAAPAAGGDAAAAEEPEEEEEEEEEEDIEFDLFD
ncbi:60S acidic ribosomal protein P0 [Gracilaria domingensis]|nr:60S acidic ribosomal protein P0 [Gracilaria domingensis]